MPRIRVLVIDDSVVIRKVLCEALTADSTIEIAGTAGGNVAFCKMPMVNPDLLTLDVEMSGMSGLETQVGIRKQDPKLSVIMFSKLTERGASTTLDALAIGASDDLAKPSNAGRLEQTRIRIQMDLVSKVKGLCLRARSPSALHAPVAGLVGSGAMSNGIARPGPRSRGGIDIVAVGTSTGGPNALATVLPSLPEAFPLPIVIVQHMPPLFTWLLAEHLNKQSAIQIHEGEHEVVLKPGEAWIALGDVHMTVVQTDNVTKLALRQDPRENSCSPAVDVLFRSVAGLYGEGTLDVVLTDMGSDSVRALRTYRNPAAM